MSSDESKLVDLARQTREGHASILDFLDHEIEASNSSPSRHTASEDDLDAMVSDFFREAERLEAEAGAGPDPARKETAPDSIPMARERTVSKGDFGREKAQSPRPAPPQTGISGAQSTSTTQPFTLFASQKRKKTGRSLILAGIFVAALAALGAGTYRFAGFRTSAVKGAKPAPAPQTAVPTVKAGSAALPAATAQPIPTPPVAHAAQPGPTRQQEEPNKSAGAKTANREDKPAQPAPARPTPVTGMPPASPPVIPAPEPKTAEVAQVPPDKPMSEPPPASAPPPTVTAVPEVTVPVGDSSQPASTVPAAPPPAIPPKPEAAPAAAIDVTPSVAISKVLPRYPAAAKQMRIGGKVDVDAQVDDQGRVVKAAAANGPGILQEAAVEAVKKWKFKPATLHGANISSTARVTVIFGRE